MEVAKTAMTEDTQAAYIPKRMRLSLFRKFRKSEDGAAMVEFSMIALPLFVIMGGIFEFTLHFLANGMLDHGVEELARQVRTKQMTADTHTEQSFKQELCGMPALQFFDCSKLKVDLQEIGSFQQMNVPLNGNGSLNSSGFGFSPGGRVTINVLRVFYEWPTFMAFHRISSDEVWSNGNRLMVSSRAFRIEP